jgi:integrase
MNRGSITKKTTAKGAVRWYVVLDLGRDADGKRQRRWHGAYATKREATAQLAALQSDRHRGTYVEPSRKTLGAFLDEWLPAVRSTIKPTTFTSYGHVLAPVHARIGDVPLRDLGAPQLNALYADLLTSGRKDGSGGLAPRTVRYCHTVLHRALRDAVRWGLLARNPTEFADPPRESADAHDDKRGMRVWDAATLRTFLAATADHRLYPAFLLAASTGMRRGEVLGLRWSDVDLDAGRLSVSQGLVTVGYEVQFSTPKTKRSRRRVELDADTVAALRSWRARQLTERMAWGPAWTDSGLVITREDGTFVHPHSLSAAFYRAVRSAPGVDPIRFHDLRHTHATLLLSANVHPKVVSERLGHATTSITLDTYSHVTETMGRGAADTMGAVLAGG